jgi:hypothetical protein
MSFITFEELMADVDRIAEELRKEDIPMSQEEIIVHIIAVRDAENEQLRGLVERALVVMPDWCVAWRNEAEFALTGKED